LINKVQEYRKVNKVTQNDLALAVDVTRQTIISLENGKYKPSLVLAHKISQYFETTIEELFIFDLEEENIC
jgi:putative transcriptional regulator